MRTGIAIAPRPTRNRGVKKAMTGLMREGSWRWSMADMSSDAHQPLARGQVAEQRPVQRLGGVEYGVVDPVLGKLGRQRRDVSLDHRAIFLHQRLRHDRNLLARFEVLE